MMSSHRDNKGMILVAVLWMIAVMAALAAIVGQTSRLNMKMAVSATDEVRCKWACRAGLERASAVLNEDSRASDSLSDSWSDNDEDFNDVPLERCRLTVRVIDEDGQELPEGVVGDLVVESPSLMMGYLDDPEETARVLTPAGLRTGDRGCADARGFLYVVGRSDGVVQCAGERVSLRELEELMEAVPGVSLACVVAVPDELLGNRLVGFVETSGGGLDAVRARMHSLPAAKRPQWLIERSELPRLGNGKVDRQRLQHDAVRATGQH